MVPVRPEVRPRLRGVSHRIAFYVALVCGLYLIAISGDRRTMITNAVYVGCLTGMFGVSATLHRRAWRPPVLAWWRRADHAMIFACIAGSYTPYCVLGLGLDSPVGLRLLALVWIAAGLGIGRALLWPHAPRAISGTLYVLVGWIMIAYFPELHATLTPTAFWLLVVGGVSFTAGACIYMARRPDPWPTVFGFHEVFHVLIIVGSSCHFVSIANLARAGT
jgi:hemolysin III